MSERVELVWYGDDAARYDHGSRHPLRPARVALTRDLIHAYGIVDGKRVIETVARDASEEELLLVHTERYIDVVRRAGHGEDGPWCDFGFGPGDNPIFPRMHEATVRVVGASLTAAEAVWSGRAEHAFNPAGGLHHAMPGLASGFCVYNDPAIVIAWLLGHGAQRVAYVDVDVHHGDGVQAVFFGDPRVLSVSVHQDGATLFPGTGAVDDLGSGDARGTKVNLPLPPFTGDDQWLRAFTDVVPPLVTAWAPDVLVTQLGCDTHHEDPLAQLHLTTTAYRRTATVLHDLAHQAAGGRWIATGGGGYQWARVVPRAWTVYFAEMAGVTIGDDLPAAWLDQARVIAGHDLPPSLSEPPARPSPVEPAEINRLVDRVKAAVWPHHG